MDTERWQILLRAIDRGSLRAAADEMDVTVSGISRSVATLEKELGFSLLHRAKSGVQPTEECRQLLPAVRDLLFAQERLEQTAAKVRGADCGTIVIGTAYNCYYEWVTRMTAVFRTRHPGVAVRIVNGTSSELAEMVKDHRTDFCLISRRDGLPVWLPIRQGAGAQKQPAGRYGRRPGAAHENRALHRKLPWHGDGYHAAVR